MTEAVVGADGIVQSGARRFRARLGLGGIRTDKQEGDGATPAGLLPLRRVLYRADRLSRPRCAVPVAPLAPNDGWCDDPGDRRYNQLVRLPCEARHEELWRADGLYDVVGVLGWNDAPAVPRRGSAIFLHVASPDGAPTAGCVALPLPDLLQVLRDGVTALRVVG